MSGLMKREHIENHLFYEILNFADSVSRIFTNMHV